MNDAVDKGSLDIGQLLEERNTEHYQGDWAVRRGWARLFPNSRMPWTRAWFKAYRDTAGRLHRVWVGDDGQIYHALGETPAAWSVVTVHQDVAWSWDASYVVTFAPWRDDLFIAFWQPPEVSTVPPTNAQNLRLDGTSDATDPAGLFHAFGVSLPAPTTAVTLAAAAAGAMTFKAYDYFSTFYDAVTGWESDRSPLADITLDQPDAPDQAPVAADGGAGAMGAGVYEYAVCFREAVTGVASELSMPRQITIAAARQVALTNIRLCPETTGTWTREIYRRSAGGIYYLLTTLADNTTQLYADNALVCPAPLTEYDEGAQQVNITNIPTYGGGGRTVYRRIYRSTGGGPYLRLTAAVAEILDNTTTTYADNAPLALGAEWERSVRVPLSGIVCAGPDNRVLWLNDKANALAAQIYPAASDDTPEAVWVDAEGAPIPLLAGTHDDPITACLDGRDGWVIGKRRAIHYTSRECTRCERILKDRGNVGPHTMQMIDSRVAILTPEGPGLVNHASPGDFIFVGPNPSRFCLASTWERVVKSRLPYATSFHWRHAGIVGWVVQTCSAWPLTPPYNDTVIVWDYGCDDGSASHRGGVVWIMDIVGLTSCGDVPAYGSGSDTIEGAFPLGVHGQLFDGEHNDGTTGVLSGVVQAVAGNIVNVESSALDGQDVVGSILWINGGTGTRVCRPVEACDGAKGLIISQCGGRLTLAGELSVAAGSEFEIGGWQTIVDPTLGGVNPQAMKKYLTLHVDVR